ncbi:oxygenase MpaB family protein [Aquirhabdus parva]|uniref:DUF2236 domain-containing protein n=1 Tax=Aquirhabdus parva TaxID=2283318 RepID=A0A345P9L7_9GAMM|nr:oxygenase MpaB family protein [Aquirhabdus parva]AXI03976.1 DUF2236 domain-containing protein [Aquirhabdus parva]
MTASLDISNSRPHRAKSFAQTQQTPFSFRLFQPVIGRDLKPSYREYRALISGLSQGDQIMDDFVEWMFSNSPKVGKQQFDQALHQGIHTVKDCPESLKRLFKHVEHTPEWFDQTLIDDALAFIHGTGTYANHVLRDAALMGGYLLSGFNQALVMTGALNKGASKRVGETYKWWIDCTEPQGLQRFGVGFKSTLHVRFIHALVRRNLAKSEKWDSDEWGLPICQVDMAATNLAFSVVFLSGLRALGIFATPHESKAVMHLWRYVGWLMGVDEQWLLASERESIALLYHTTLTQSAPDWTSQELGKALSIEPLSRHYANLESVRRLYAYHKHLSVSRYFLGQKKMQQLGLPKQTLPWFPLITAPINVVSYTAQRLVPTIHSALQQRGRQAQLDMLAQFGEHGHGTIQPDKHHPAHV